MKTITFTQNREFDYGHGAVMHKPGDSVAVHEGGHGAVMSGERLVSIRMDKAERWLRRGAAQADVKVAHDKPVERPADVAGADSGGAGERAVDVADAGKPAAKQVHVPPRPIYPAPAPAGRGRK